MLAQVSFQVERCKISGSQSQLHIKITFIPPSRIFFLHYYLSLSNTLGNFLMYKCLLFIFILSHLNWIIGPNSQPLPWTLQVHTTEVRLFFPHLLSLSSALRLALANEIYTDVTQAGAWNMLAQLDMFPLVILPLAWDESWKTQVPASPVVWGEMHEAEPHQFTHCPEAIKVVTPT